MLVDKKVGELPQATIVSKVTGTSDIPDTLTKFIPDFGTYGFTDMELLKDWKSSFAVMSGQKDIALHPDPTYQGEWMNDDNDPDDNKGVFTNEEEKIIISG